MAEARVDSDTEVPKAPVKDENTKQTKIEMSKYTQTMAIWTTRVGPSLQLGKKATNLPNLRLGVFNAERL